MAFIYIVAESETDALFYVACAERITGMALDFHFYKSERGSGIHQARRMLRHMLADARNAFGGGPGVFWIAALDNDRAPQYPDGVRPSGTLSGFDHRKANRHSGLLDEAAQHQPTIPGAIAVPVEMLESWVLQALSPGTALELPPFSEQASALAIEYFRANHHTSPPPQLKDLARAAMKLHDCQDWETFVLDVASKLDADAVARHSRSFGFFRDDLRAWPVT